MDTIMLTPPMTEPSLLKWGFHIETVRQFLMTPTIPAEATAYYKGVKEYKDQGGILWRDCTEDSKIVRYVERLRELVRSINEEGYRPGSVIDVIIKRNGTFLIHDGHHRAAVMYVLGRPIPARIIKKHPQWETLISTAESLYEGKRQLYHPIDHPLFAGWSVARDVSARSGAIIRLEDSWESIRVLDIGACHGGLAFRMADAGASVTAAEQSLKYMTVGKLVESLLRANYGMPIISWYAGDGWQAATTRAWDWILCLSVMHHWMKQPGGYEEVKQKLGVLLANARRGVVVEFGTRQESQMKATEVPSTQKELGEWLHDMHPGYTWFPLLEGVPTEQRMSGSDYRWLWAARTNHRNRT